MVGDPPAAATVAAPWPGHTLSASTAHPRAGYRRRANASRDGASPWSRAARRTRCSSSSTRTWRSSSGRCAPGRCCAAETPSRVHEVASPGASSRPIRTCSGPIDGERIVVEGRMRWMDEERVLRDDPMIWALEFRDGLLFRSTPAHSVLEAEALLAAPAALGQRVVTSVSSSRRGSRVRASTVCRTPNTAPSAREARAGASVCRGRASSRRPRPRRTSSDTGRSRGDRLCPCRLEPARGGEARHERGRRRCRLPDDHGRTRIVGQVTPVPRQRLLVSVSTDSDEYPHGPDGKARRFRDSDRGNLRR